MVDGIHEMGDGFHGMVDGIHEMGDGFHGMGDGFHNFGGWIPYFFHGMGDGLHTFLRWIPWDEGWTPHFFKMDSMEWGMDFILF